MTIYIVEPGQSINTAIGKAGPGDTVQVNAGSYGSIKINGRQFPVDNPLKILMSEGAKIKGIAINGSASINIRGFEITGTPPDNYGCALMRDSSYIWFDQLNIHDVPSQSTAHAAVRVYRCQHTTVTNVTMERVVRGVEIQHSSDTWVSGCSGTHIEGVEGDSDAFVTYDDSIYTVFADNEADVTRDDGYDCWTSKRTLIVRCKSKNTYFKDDGNGFKLGSGETGSGDHIVIGCYGENGAGGGVNFNNGPLGSLVVNCEMTGFHYGFVEPSSMLTGSRVLGCKASGNDVNFQLRGPGTIRDDSYVATVSDLPEWIYGEDVPERYRNLAIEALGGGGPDPDPIDAIFEVGDGDDALTLRVSGDDALAIIQHLAAQLQDGDDCALDLTGEFVE